ncbi:MAG: hypothetical protein ABI972_22605 [Acidobacteriota bacterium]
MFAAAVVGDVADGVECARGMCDFNFERADDLAQNATETLAFEGFVEAFGEQAAHLNGLFRIQHLLAPGADQVHNVEAFAGVGRADLVGRQQDVWAVGGAGDDA